MGPGRDYQKQLLDALLPIGAFSESMTGAANRGMLTRGLPYMPVTTIARYPAPLADLSSIVGAAAGMGQLLDSGEWALVIVTRNALPFAQGTSQERVLTALLAGLETSPTATSSLKFEIVIGQDERLPIHFLERGLVVSRSVAKIIVTRVIDGAQQHGNGSRVTATAWLIAPGLLITNHHVIEARYQREPRANQEELIAQTHTAQVWFNYHDNEGDHYEYGGWELLHSSRILDYAILRQSSQSTGPVRPLEDWGFLPVVATQAKLCRGFRLNIIQHPLGGPKRLAIRSNFFFDWYSTAQEPDRLRYLTDTEPGSSGSPVLDDEWRVLAIHHASVSISEERYRNQVIKFTNQGISTLSIIKDLPSALQREISAAQCWS